MKKLLSILIIFITITAHAYEFKVGDVIAWTKGGKHHEGRITERVKRPGQVLFLRVYEFGAWAITEVHAANRPLLIAATN